MSDMATCFVVVLIVAGIVLILGMVVPALDEINMSARTGVLILGSILAGIFYWGFRGR